MATYYTPSIEEFHPGFEYEFEIFYENNSPPIHEWLERQCSVTDDLIEIVCEIDEGNIRVKHLDREDFKKLGWEVTNGSNSGDLWCFTFDIPETETEEESNKYHDTYMIGSTIWIWYNSESKVAKISIGNGPDILFSGRINNKSELKRLMKQLNID